MPFDAGEFLRGLQQLPARRPSPRSLPMPPPAEWLAAWKRSPQMVPPPQPCWWCSGTLFWQNPFGSYLCANCRPPAIPSRAVMWLRLDSSKSVPMILVLGGAPSNN
jgi:hypothetical protein